jgi:NAD(P)-dependent dehydrogenase (short-subunit alcohol dehydrogenase family)
VSIQLFDVNVNPSSFCVNPPVNIWFRDGRARSSMLASLNSFIGELVAPYTTSKGAVNQLTKPLSNEWARYNIQVNALAPGFIATDMLVSPPPQPMSYGDVDEVILLE